MEIGIIHFDGKNKRNADCALASLSVFFEHYTSCGDKTYIPVSVNDNIYGEVDRHFFDEQYVLHENIERYRCWDAVFVRVNDMHPAMQSLFLNKDKMSQHEVKKVLYDYAVEIVKELLQDDNHIIAGFAILLMKKYNLCGQVCLPESYCRTVYTGEYNNPENVKALAKAYSEAI